MKKSRFVLILALITVICFFNLAAVSVVKSLTQANQYKMFYPQGVNDVVSNPFIGFAPPAGETDITFPHSLVYVGASWKELEPGKGVYDFEGLEEKNHYSYWRERKVKIILRIYLDEPDEDYHTDIPNWLYQETNKDGIWYRGEHGKGFSPNYSNPKIVTYHEKLIEAVAERYNSNDQLAFVELGSIGHWGEWHTQVEEEYKVPFPPEKIYNQYVEHYLKYFTQKQLLIRRPITIARDHRLGLYNDSFGNVLQTEDYFIKWYQKGYLDYLTGTKQPAMPEFWKYAPSGGEFTLPPGTSFLSNVNLSRTMMQLKQSHTSWLGPSCPVYDISDPDVIKNRDSLLKLMGYRYVIKSVKCTSSPCPGKDMEVNWVVDNTGVAPFYYLWPVEISLCDSDGKVVFRYITKDDTRKWLPGANNLYSSFKLPTNLPTGTYNLCFAILDPADGKPGVVFAVEGRQSDGRYSVGTISVGSPQTVLP
ncbi:MAG: DUF4832 domain-containing protein [Chitinophagales bacterium]